MARPEVLFSPTALAGLKRGFDNMANLLAITLGPTQGVIISQSPSDSMPELISNAATAARRVLALPRAAEDVGAMLLRHLVWQVHERVGDGSATTAVLAQAILNQACRCLVAGANAMWLRQGIQRAMSAAVEALRGMARPVRGEEELTGLAETVTGEPELSLILGEMFDVLGASAYITIEDYVAPYLDRTYYEGGRWGGRLASRYLITDHAGRRAIAQQCHVLLFNGLISEVDQIRPAMELTMASNESSLLVVAKEIVGAALGTLVKNHQEGNLKTIAVEFNHPETKRREDFEDLAILTRGRVFIEEIGPSLRSLTEGDLGTARRVEAGAEELVVIGGDGNSAEVRGQIERLRHRVIRTTEHDGRDRLQQRLARLTGSSAILKIGASTKAERTVLRQKAEKGIRVLSAALQEGVVPGGGIAYLNCIPTLAQVEASGDEMIGVQIVARALEAPFIRLVRNAGAASPAVVMNNVRQKGPGFGYDVLRGRIVQMEQGGILDAAKVSREALQTAASGAVMALTTEAIVLRRNPETSFEP